MQTPPTIKSSMYNSIFSLFTFSGRTVFLNIPRIPRVVRWHPGVSREPMPRVRRGAVFSRGRAVSHFHWHCTTAERDLQPDHTHTSRLSLHSRRPPARGPGPPCARAASPHAPRVRPPPETRGPDRVVAPPPRPLAPSAVHRATAHGPGGSRGGGTQKPPGGRSPTPQRTHCMLSSSSSCGRITGMSKDASARSRSASSTRETFVEKVEKLRSCMPSS